MSGKAAIVFRGMPLLCKLVASERQKLFVPTPLSDKASQTGLSSLGSACLVMCPAVRGEGKSSPSLGRVAARSTATRSGCITLGSSGLGLGQRE
jgi:hypothetical protein